MQVCSMESVSHLPAPTRISRDELFRESPVDKARRWAIGAAWALRPKRIPELPEHFRLLVRDLVAPSRELPDAAHVARSGLAGIVHDLSPSTLMEAYSRGLYPFAHIGPLKWRSPPQRTLLFFDQFHISKNLRRSLRQGRYSVTFDRDIEAVLKACGTGRKFGVTWISPRIMRAFAEAHDAGLVHSFEVWNARGELAGGGYGLALGGSFTTESQFSRERDTSKLGFAFLNFHLARWGFAFNDGKVTSPTLRDMGFRDVPRSEYLERLSAAVLLPGRPGRWATEADAREVADWRPQQPRMVSSTPGSSAITEHRL